MNKIAESTNLYDTDFNEWVTQTVHLLKSQQFSDLDLENLIEEVEALSRSDKREIRSRLIVLLSHLLKYAYQPDKRSDSWLNTISEQRRQIELILEDSPSLRNYLSEIFAHCYEKAKAEAIRETKLPVDRFPQLCPFSHNEVLDLDWLPETSV